MGYLIRWKEELRTLISPRDRKFSSMSRCPLAMGRCLRSGLLCDESSPIDYPMVYSQCISTPGVATPRASAYESVPLSSWLYCLLTAPQRYHILAASEQAGEIGARVTQ